MAVKGFDMPDRRVETRRIAVTGSEAIEAAKGGAKVYWCKLSTVPLTKASLRRPDARDSTFYIDAEVENISGVVEALESEYGGICCAVHNLPDSILPGTRIEYTLTWRKV